MWELNQLTAFQRKAGGLCPWGGLVLVLLACRTLLGFSLEQGLRVVRVPYPGKPLSSTGTSVAVKTLGWVVSCQCGLCSHLMQCNQFF